MARTVGAVTIKERIITERSFNHLIKSADLVLLLQQCSVIPKTIDPDTVEVGIDTEGVRLIWSQTTVENK